MIAVTNAASIAKTKLFIGRFRLSQKPDRRAASAAAP
jgi:hypothetical protein